MGYPRVIEDREMNVKGKSIDEADDDIERRMVEDSLKNSTVTKKSGSRTRPEPPGVGKEDEATRHQRVKLPWGIASLTEPSRL